MRRLIPLLFLLTACGQGTPAVQGRVSVIDGDTLDHHGARIRLWGVDAPESRQTCEAAGQTYRCGQLASNRLDQHLAGRTVACFEQDVDRYGRMVARCGVEGDDLGAWLVREGLAVRYARYAGTAYWIEELQARREKRGVWAGTFETPEDWRRDQRS